MSKFQSIQQMNRFAGASQQNQQNQQNNRSIKQVLEQHKQEATREKTYKCESLCVEQYHNPYSCNNNNNKNNECIIDEIDSNDDFKLIKLSSLSSLPHPIEEDKQNVHVELPIIYDTPKTNDDIKPVEVETEVENIKTELKRKQSLRDVVKLSYKHFLQKEFTNNI